MAAQYRIECPQCATSYTPQRCGMRDLAEDESAVITVKCLVCGWSFDTSVRPKFIVVTPGWFQRVVMRKKPVEQRDGVVAESVTR